MKTKKINLVDREFIFTPEIRPQIRLDFGELLMHIHDMIPYEDIPEFIALLDESYEDWDVTEKIINHFEAVKLEMISELDEGEKIEIKPKKLT